MDEPTAVSTEIIAFLDAYAVLPTYGAISDHLGVLDADVLEAKGLLREDLVKVANHLRSALVAARAFMDAWDRLTAATAKVEEDLPGTLVGGLLSESVKLSKMFTDTSEGGVDA